MISAHNPGASALPSAESTGPVSPSQPALQAAQPVSKRRWFRRKRVTFPLAILGILLIAGSVIGWRVYASFGTINQVSTPPAEVSGVALGGETDASVETGPAVAAVATYEAAKREAAASGSGTGGDDSNSGAAAVTNPTEVAPTVTSEPTVPPADDTQIASAPTTEPVIAADDTGAGSAPTNEPVIAAATDEPVSGNATDPVPTATVTTDTSSEPVETPAADLPVIAEPTIVLPAYGEDSLDILLMGVDAREAEAIDVGVRPDALAVLHLDRATGACRLLSIPRDTRVELPGYGQSKINHALAVGGVPYEIQVVEQYLGVEMDHYGLIDFSGVVQVVDAVGGVEVDNPAAFTAAGFDFPVGPQTLDGERALAYARFRGDADGDFGRIGRQQEVLRALMEKVSPGDLVSMIPGMLTMLEDHFRTDLSPLDMADLATTYGQSCTYETLETSTLEGGTATYFDPIIQLNLSYVIIDEQELERKREWLLEGA